MNELGDFARKAFNSIKKMRICKMQLPKLPAEMPA
jgi:hypothetical protein